MSDLPQPLTSPVCDLRATPMPAELVRVLARDAGIDPDWAIQFCIESGMTIGGLN